eukprot:TRINITY_DN7163_c0_g1_i1.p1 TRINITY_DN7163_c0_g1~~TRINITY_DN7163_c0_g1_i1.p1  ORF type:complete len:724 (+),score=260.18 TRINITY_DN7163_c0_g1_i1:75-2246(+)
MPRNKGKRAAAPVQSEKEQKEQLLQAWTQRNLQELLQCTPEETAVAAAQVLSMPPAELRRFCEETLTPIAPSEQRLSEDERFFSRFVQKKGELGLLDRQAPGGGGMHSQAVAGAADTASDAGTAVTSATTATEAKKKGRKYMRPVDPAKLDGQDALLPVKQFCGCEARKHEFVCNCLVCGKIVCEQEGEGYCFFCASEVRRGMVYAKKGPADAGGGEEQYLASEREFLKAVAQRDRLLRYQSERARRTEVIDDQEDYFETSHSGWLNSSERKDALEKEERMREERMLRHRKGGAFQVHLDLVSGSLEQGLKYSESQKAKDQLRAPVEVAMEEDEEEQIRQAAAGLAEEAAAAEAARRDIQAAAGGDGGGGGGGGGGVWGRPRAVDEEEEEEEEEEDVRPAGGLRVLANPDAIAGVQFHPGAVLQQRARELVIERYGMGEIEAQKLVAPITTRGTLRELRHWANQVGQSKGIEDPMFADWISKTAEELGLAKRWEKAGVGAAKAEPTEAELNARAGGLEKADMLVASKGTGRVQTDFDANVLDDAPKKPVRVVARLKQPWVKVNSAEARKLDMRTQLQRGSNRCLSMHQPWASLLVYGIKRHEGRTWETQHRGRLWIHAAAHEPSDEDIHATENYYRSRGASTFPTHYPTSCLLGCVTVDDCLSSDDYERKVPAAEQESQSEWVFLCSNPQLLVLPLPMDGKHKVFQLDRKTLAAAHRQAGREM